MKPIGFTATSAMATLCITAILISDASGAGASKYPTVAKMIEEVGEYSAEAGTFKVIERQPLHIEISPVGFAADAPRTAESRVHMAAVETLNRAFIHTPVDKITVTVLPKTLVPGKPEAGELLTHLRVTVTATRKAARALLNQYFPGKDFDDLVNGEEKSTLFNRMTFPDQGEPGVEKAFTDLAQKGQ